MTNRCVQFAYEHTQNAYWIFTILLSLTIFYAFTLIHYPFVLLSPDEKYDESNVNRNSFVLWPLLALALLIQRLISLETQADLSLSYGKGSLYGLIKRWKAV